MQSRPRCIPKLYIALQINIKEGKDYWCTFYPFKYTKIGKITICIKVNKRKKKKKKSYLK